ncbi:hypothetical protein [Nonomuraea sp. NPDC050202]|uniref:hypothetical protein n=1 Tax=Nonomuraea sp. NPDC050202 TaxID=3155035 RepID=UPI0033C9637E
MAILALIHAGTHPWPLATGQVEPRTLLQRYPPQHVLAHGLYELAIGLAGRDRRDRALEWHADLHECPKPLSYALSLVSAALRMRLADVTHLGWRATCWMLASEIRTWGALIPAMVAALHQVLQSQGWGSAAWTLLTVPAVVDPGRPSAPPLEHRRQAGAPAVVSPARRPSHPPAPAPAAARPSAPRPARTPAGSPEQPGRHLGRRGHRNRAGARAVA